MYPWRCFWKVLHSLTQWALSNTLRAWIEQKGGGRVNLLLSNFSTLGSWASDSGWDLNPWLPWVLRSSVLNQSYINGFPASPVCRWQTMKLLHLHNCIKQSLMINIFLFIYICVCVCLDKGISSNNDATHDDNCNSLFTICWALF